MYIHCNIAQPSGTQRDTTHEFIPHFIKRNATQSNLTQQYNITNKESRNTELHIDTTELLSFNMFSSGYGTGAAELDLLVSRIVQDAFEQCDSGKVSRISKQLNGTKQLKVPLGKQQMYAD